MEVTIRLAEEGKLVTLPVRGGVTLYLPEDAPARGSLKNVLGKILEDDEPKEELEIFGPAEDEDN